MRYGLPYKGSKNRIAEEIVSVFPRSKHFYDLFAGGCSVSHAAILSRKYNVIHINDKRKEIVDFFISAIKQQLPAGWMNAVSREAFHLMDKNDPLRLIWSFGNNERNYLYGDTEKVKLAAHKMIVSDSISERYQAYKEFIRELESSGRLQNVERIQSVERINGIDILRHLDIKVESSFVDYQDVSVLPESVVYADPPYKGTDGYSEPFDHARFEEWLRNTSFPVFISEYSMPSDFKCIAEFQKACAFSPCRSDKPVVERLFIHERFENSIQKQATFDF